MAEKASLSRLPCKLGEAKELLAGSSGGSGKSSLALDRLSPLPAFNWNVMSEATGMGTKASLPKMAGQRDGESSAPELGPAVSGLLTAGQQTSLGLSLCTLVSSVPWSRVHS